mgnify:CR=1 FL=1
MSKFKAITSSLNATLRVKRKYVNINVTDVSLNDYVKKDYKQGNGKLVALKVIKTF